MPSSIRDIARASGFSTATVSLVLRGGGRISVKTREKIHAVAKAMDYRSHPLLSKAFSLARQPDATRYRETFGFIIEWPTETGPDYQKKIHAAAQERTRSLGYKLESFILSGKPSDQRQFSRILHARGIRGLIIIPRLERRQPRLYLEWKNFAAVEIGRTLWSPRNLHHVETADYHKIIEAFHLLKKAGYHRVGMAIEPTQNKHQRGIYNAAALVMQLRLPKRQRIPPLSSYGPWGEASFRRWMEQYKPDVLFIHEKLADEFYVWLKKLGMRVPRDISLFCSNVERDAFSGLRRDYQGMGRSAVEMLSLLLESGDIGLAENPRCWQIDEFWQTGTTLSRPIASHIPQLQNMTWTVTENPAK